MDIFKVETDIAHIVFVQGFRLQDGNFITGPICNGRVLKSFGLSCRVGNGENWVRDPTSQDIEEVLRAAQSAPFVRTPDFGVKKHGGSDWGDRRVFGDVEYISCGWAGFPNDIVINPQTNRYGGSYVFFPYL